MYVDFIKALVTYTKLILIPKLDIVSNGFHKIDIHLLLRNWL